MPVGHPASPQSPRGAGRPVIPLISTTERQRTRQSITVGIAGTIVFHLLMLFGIPSSFFALDAGADSPPPDEFDIEVMSEEEAVPPDDMRFVETNPNAPQNAPDETDNFSARDQQAANLEEAEQLSDDHTPQVDGTELDSDKIITGDLNPPVPTATPTDPSEESVEVSPSDPSAVSPMPGIDESEGDDEEGVASSEAETGPNPAPVPEKIDGRETESTDLRPPVFSTPSDPHQASPAPRPRLPRAPPGPVERRPAGVTSTGYIGVDATFSQFGEYLERMVEAVSLRWHDLCASRSYSEAQSQVVVRFTLHRDGTVSDMAVVQSTSKTLGALLCRSAIDQTAPYGPWTEEMVRVLGDERTINFTFHYW